LSHRKLAFGTVAFLASVTVGAAILVTSFSALETINPLAAATAVAVALIGLIWFKKTNH
jgi:4-hydroxybenzoate polyprenyltransferase